MFKQNKDYIKIIIILRVGIVNNNTKFNISTIRINRDFVS